MTFRPGTSATALNHVWKTRTVIPWPASAFASSIHHGDGQSRRMLFVQKGARPMTGLLAPAPSHDLAQARSSFRTT